LTLEISCFPEKGNDTAVCLAVDWSNSIEIGLCNRTRWLHRCLFKIFNVSFCKKKYAICQHQI